MYVKVRLEKNGLTEGSFVEIVARNETSSFKFEIIVGFFLSFLDVVVGISVGIAIGYGLHGSGIESGT
jgi:hypothetical protein